MESRLFIIILEALSQTALLLVNLKLNRFEMWLRNCINLEV